MDTVGMEDVSITDFLKAIDGQAANRNALPNHVSGISIDSRTITAGDVFWAIRGENHDGHDYVASAMEKGASACVVQTMAEPENHNQSRWIHVKNTQVALGQLAKWHRRRYSPTTIGVTGSYGKTTTRELLYSVLSARHPGLQSENNYNNEIGVPLTLLNLKQSHRFLIVEMGAARPGDILPLTHAALPNIGIITGIGPAHLSGFHTLEQIAKTKSDLIAGLPKQGLALIPGNSQWTTQLRSRAQCRVITFGFDPINSYHASKIHIENTKLVFEANGYEYHLPMNGRHHLETGLSVIATATELGCSPEEIQQGFDAFPSVSGRGDVKSTSPWTIIDDTYNANPASCQAACETLANWNTTGKRILVLGDMLELGPAAADYHLALGQFAGEQQIDMILALGEHAGQLVAGVKKLAKPNTIALSFSKHRDLIGKLQEILTPNDVVLVKGSRGMRMERVVETLLKSIKTECSMSAA